MDSLPRVQYDQIHALHDLGPGRGLREIRVKSRQCKRSNERDSYRWYRCAA